MIKIRDQPILSSWYNTKAPLKAPVISPNLFRGCTKNRKMPMAEILHHQPKDKHGKHKAISHLWQNNSQYNTSCINHKHPKFNAFYPHALNQQHFSNTVGHNAAEKPYEQHELTNIGHDIHVQSQQLQFMPERFRAIIPHDRLEVKSPYSALASQSRGIIFMG